MTVIAITGEIVERHVEIVRSASRRDSDTELFIVISSHGGDLNAAFAIADLIEAHPGPTSARAIRQCSSAALIVLTACQSRAARLGVRFQLHDTEFQSAPGGPLTARRLHAAATRLEAADHAYRARLIAAGVDPEALGRLICPGAVLNTLDALDRPADRCDRPPCAGPGRRRPPGCTRPGSQRQKNGLFARFSAPQPLAV